jgi:hypothetical protein
MNIFQHAAKACRSASRSLLAAHRAFLRMQPVTLDRTLESIARVLCVQSHGVMICGSAGASVAHFSNPHFSAQQTACGQHKAL